MSDKPELSKKSSVSNMKASSGVRDEKQKGRLTASKGLSSSRTLGNSLGFDQKNKNFDDDEEQKKVRFEQKVAAQEEAYKEEIDVDKMMGTELKKDLVFEVKPYFSHSILQMTMALHILWTIGYMVFRIGFTINKQNYATWIYSCMFILVEILSFFGTALHYNNYTNPQTNILVQKLPDILARLKKDYPPVAALICCYKEPQHIVSRTIRTAMSMKYPPEKLLVGLLDDSSNFRESRGWVHVQSIEKNFLEQLLKAAVSRTYTGTIPTLSEDEDPRGVMAPALDKIASSVTEAIDAEVQWFLEYLLLNVWTQASEAPDRSESEIEAERELIADLRNEEFNPYRTFTEEDLENISKFSVEGLQLMWHGSAFFRPLVRNAIIQRAGMKNWIKKLNDTNELRFLTPQALAIARYRVLYLGREEMDVLPEVSAGNVRVDFEATGSVLCPRGVYIRRRKPQNPHNKAGNINNALFNEFTETDFEYQLMLDADQQPHPDFLQRVIPYFFSAEGPMIAWVQTPQFFSNIFPADDPLGHRNMEFYGPVAEGRGAHGATPFVGTNAIFSRSHLCEVGGVMYNSVTEDMYTGMKLHSAGYKSMYHNEVLAIGSAPVDLKETLEQRKRWAQGAVEIFSLTPWGLLIKKIGWRKTLFYLDSCIYPFTSWTAFFFGISPFVMAIWQVPIVVDNPALFVLVGFVPTMILPRMINYMLLRAVRPHEEGRSAPALWIEATDLWRAEQTFFSFAGTYMSAWHAGRNGIKTLILKYNIKGDIAMWNWNRDFLKPKPGDSKKPKSKIPEQSFRTSIKESDQVKNTRLFVANIILFTINILAILLGCFRFNCDTSQIWIFVVIVGFGFSNCWHLWSFIPMALRQNEDQWPYASSYHAHNIFIAFILGFLVFLFLKVKICIYQLIDKLPGANPNYQPVASQDTGTQ
eukprot:TRINITY_DN2731_c0_g1_i1.p1 TRINITY_DN2731_c0_g1~~TRINITY_DN2731_c0_g1_i1.p1  ORF type:complete len:925 (-),score=227.96 TRINITY_DN2731_c0_g1_i1:114-2888(-)